MPNVLHYLASHPATQVEMLRALVDLALGMPLRSADPQEERFHANASLRVALLRNPHLSAAQMGALLADLPAANWRPAALHVLATQPHVSAQQVVTALGSDHSATSLRAVLHPRMPDPDGVLARHALAHGAGTMVWGELVANPAGPLDVRTAAAMALARHAKQVPGSDPGTFEPLSARTTSAVVSLAKTVLASATNPAEHADAVAWVTELTQVSAQVRPVPAVPDEPGSLAARTNLTAHLLGLDLTYRPAVRGSRAWLASPATTVQDALDWVNEAPGTTRCAQAVTTHPDPDGAIAAHAMATYPHSPTVAKAVAKSATTPLRVRQAAYTELFAHPATVRWAQARMYDIANSFEREFAIGLASAGHLDGSALRKARERQDLTSADLDTLVAAYLDCDERELNPERLRSSIGLWLATHPAATPDQRARGRALASPNRYFGGGQSDRDVADLVIGLDPGADPGSAARVGGNLPLSVVAGVDQHPSIAWLLSSALHARLGSHFPRGAATALVALAEDFTGTLNELLDTVETISA